VATGQVTHLSLLPGWLPPPVLAMLVAALVLLGSLFAAGVLPGALASVGSSATPTATTLGAGNGNGGSPTAAATMTVAPTPTQPVQSSGSQALVGPNACFDLDNGTATDSTSTDADFCWNVADPTRTLTPVNGAQIALQNAGTEPSFVDCQNAPVRGDPINGSTNANEIPSGTYLCFRTNVSRVARVLIDMYGPTLTIDYITWRS
jgi:hypothetical protein